MRKFDGSLIKRQVSSLLPFGTEEIGGIPVIAMELGNGIEFILGGTIGLNDIAKLPQISTAGGNMIFTFIRSQASINGVSTVDIQVGDNLSDWPTSYPVPATALADNPGLTVVKDSPAAGKVTVTLTLPLNPGVNAFVRTKVIPLAYPAGSSMMEKSCPERPQEPQPRPLSL